MAFDDEMQDILLRLFKSVQSGELTANQARESLTRLVAGEMRGEQRMDVEHVRLAGRREQQRAKLLEQQAAERARLKEVGRIVRMTRDISKHGPSSPTVTAAIARLKELGAPVEAGRMEQAAEAQHRRLFEDANKEITSAGAPLPENFEQKTKVYMQTDAGRARMKEEVNKAIADAKVKGRKERYTARMDKAAMREAARAGFSPKEAATRGPEAAATRMKLGRDMFSIEGDLAKQAGRAKLTRGGLWAGGAGILAYLLANKIFKKDEGPELSPEMQMQMAMMAQQQAKQSEAGDTIQDGRQLRNVSTLLGIMKMLQGMQGMQMQAPPMSRIA